MSNATLKRKIGELLDKVSTNNVSITITNPIDENIDNELLQLTKELRESTSLSKEEHDAVLASICGLHIWNGSHDIAHEHTQELTNAIGSYLHGIIHRIEPDYPNALYWFRNAGGHPVGEKLQQDVAKLVQNENNDKFQQFNQQHSWDGALLTKMFESILQNKSSSTKEIELLEEMQTMELKSLLDAIRANF